MAPFRPLTESPYPAGPEALPPTPRRLQLTRKTRIVRALLLAALLLTPNVALVVGFLSGADVRALTESGVRTTGKVEYMWETRASRSGPTYHVSYWVTVSGQTYLQETTVTRAEYVGLREGGACVVTYLPSDPRISCLGSPGQKLNRLDETFLVLAGLAVLVSGFALAWIETSVRREIRLATHGLATVGLVIDNGTQRTRNGTLYWARYQFSSPTDEHATGWHWVPQFIWDQVPRGTTVTILYDPDSPSRHKPLYAFKHLRLFRAEEAQPSAPAVQAASCVPRSTDIAQLPHDSTAVASQPPGWYRR